MYTIKLKIREQWLVTRCAVGTHYIFQSLLAPQEADAAGELGVTFSTESPETSSGAYDIPAASSGSSISIQSSSIFINTIGISLSALLDFCDQHKSKLPGMTTKAVCDEIIKPATAHQSISYLELHPEMSGEAEMFISHAWLMLFLDLVHAIQSEAQKLLLKDPRFWIDIFGCNQHAPPSNTDFGFWSNGFEGALVKIHRRNAPDGRIPSALIVLSPYDDPIWMSRCWCLFEFYIIKLKGLGFRFVMPANQKCEFLKSLEAKGNKFLDLMSKIDMSSAKAYDPSDERNIKSLVLKNLGGYTSLNESVAEAVRNFCIDCCLDALQAMNESSKSSSNLLYNTAHLLYDVGDYNRSASLLNEDLHFKNSRRADEQEIADTQNMLALVQERLGNFPEALELYEKSLEIKAKSLGLDHVSVAGTEKNIGVVLCEQGDLENGLVHHTKSGCFWIFSLNRYLLA